MFVYAKRSRSRSLYPLGDSQHEACKATTKRLCREIAQLQKAVDKLSEQNSELDERQADVEHRQDGVEEAVDCASVDIGELEQECTRLRQRLPEELEDLLAEHMSDRMREHIETVLQDKIPDAIRGCVMDWLREHEDTIRGPVLGPYNEMLEAQVQKYIDDKMIEWQVDINKKMSSVFQH